MSNILDDLEFSSEDEKSEWAEAAYNFRLPYWDWALMPQNGIPSIFRTAKIKICEPNKPDGSRSEPSEGSNPLSCYFTRDAKGDPVLMGSLPAPYTVPNNFNGNDPPLPWSQCSGISRWAIDRQDPVPPDQAAGINKWIGANKALESHYYYVRQRDKDGNEKRFNIEKYTIGELVYRLLNPGNVTSYKA